MTRKESFSEEVNLDPVVLYTERSEDYKDSLYRLKICHIYSEIFLGLRRNLTFNNDFILKTTDICEVTHGSPST